MTLSRVIRRSLLLLSILLVLQIRTGATQTTVRPDSIAVPPRLQNDTITQSLALEGRWFQVRAERDSRGTPTGHYTVFSVWPDSNRFVTTYIDYAYDDPAVAFIADGLPAVVVLSSYTGGMGSQRIPNYTFKLLVADAHTSSVRAFTLDPGDGTFWSNHVVSFSRLVHGGFALRIEGGPVVRYERQVLTWQPPPSR
jgi:hypothetical protein